MRNLSLLFSLIVLLVGLGACRHQPIGILSPSAMEELLMEIHLAEGVLEKGEYRYTSSYRQEEMRQAVFLRKGIEKAEFDSSLVWYGRNLDLFIPIYDKVIQRLTERAQEVASLAREESEGAVSIAGDSVNVWSKSIRLFLSSTEDNLFVFNVEGDENYKKGDTFIWRMRMRSLPHDATTLPRLSLSVRYTDGTDTSYVEEPLENGWVRLTLPTDSVRKVRTLSGSLFLRHSQQPYRTLADSITLYRVHLSKPLSEDKKP